MPTPDIFLVPPQFPTIQAAVDAVVGPTTIVVWPGVWAECVVVDGKESLVIQSSRLTRRGVFVCGGAAGTAVFTVKGSTLSLSGLEVRSNGRMRGLLVNDSTLSLQDCVVAGNRTADETGAGMDCRGSSVRLQKSAIVGNTIDREGASGAAGGGLFFRDCSIEIAGCTVQANAVHASDRARGGGIWCEASRMRMWRSRVTDNALRAGECAGAGLYFRDAGRCELGGSVVSGNGSVEGRGGGIFVEGDPAGVSIHRNTFVKQNHPDDVCSPPRGGGS